MGEWIAYALASAATIFTTYKVILSAVSYVKRGRLKRLRALWEAGDLDNHLALCEAYLQRERPGSDNHQQLLVAYAEGLIVAGRWVEAQAAIERVSRLRTAAYSSEHLRRAPLFLLTLLLQGKFEDAKRVHDEHVRALHRSSRDVVVYHYIRFVLAVYEFYLGDMKTACGMLHNLAGEHPPRLDRVQILYFLGCAECELGRTRAAKTHLDKAIELGEGTYVAGAVAEFWKEHNVEEEAPVS